MQVGIIGVGNIGGTLARQLVGVGHDVVLSNSRGPATLEPLAHELGGHARAGTVEDAAAFGDVVIVSVPFGRYRELPRSGFAGKVVIDTNNYYPQRDGPFAELDDDTATSSELLARHLEGARVVKAFNSIFWEHLRDFGRPAGQPGRIGIPVSGDDDAAKRVVIGLINEIGFDAVDAGSLPVGGRKHQPGSAVYTADLPTENLRAALR
jgi:8-hydroxy-5-deazaflavin:NADPH oxidoreductase